MDKEDIQFDLKVREQDKPVIEPIKFNIPDCCREGWDTCKHGALKQRKIKRNIAL